MPCGAIAERAVSVEETPRRPPPRMARSRQTGEGRVRMFAAKRGNWWRRHVHRRTVFAADMKMRGAASQ